TNGFMRRHRPHLLLDCTVLKAFAQRLNTLLSCDDSPQSPPWLTTDSVSVLSLSKDIVNHLAAVADSGVNKPIIIAKGDVQFENVIARLDAVEAHPLMQLAMTGSIAIAKIKDVKTANECVVVYDPPRVVPSDLCQIFA
ncbi:hypothetical protein L914_10400, partial [Phytophthora nicotianae]